MAANSIFWDSAGGLGRPSFVSETPPFHPLALASEPVVIQIAAALVSATFLVLLSRRRIPRPAIALAAMVAIGLCIFADTAVALLVLGIVSSLVLLAGFAVNPLRATWIALTLTLAVAIFGDTTGFLMLFLVPLGAIVVRSSLKKTPERRNSVIAGATFAALVAALVTSFWWMPWWQLTREAHDRRGVIDLARDDLPRFFLADGIMVEPNATRAAAILEGIGDARSMAVIDHIPQKIRRLAADGLQPSQLGEILMSGARAKLQSDGEGRLSLRVHSDGWNFLATNQPWWSGWRVYWNEDRLPPVVVNVAFVGTFVPPGEGTLRFRFRPEQFDAGLRWSGAAVILFLASVFWPWFLRVRTTVVSPELVKRRKNRVRRVVSAATNAAAQLNWIRLVKPAVIALLAVYTFVLVMNRVRVAGGADSSGYLNQARMWSSGHLLSPLTSPLQLGTPSKLDPVFAPLGFLPAQFQGLSCRFIRRGFPCTWPCCG